jgi:hypothetical protein
MWYASLVQLMELALVRMMGMQWETPLAVVSGQSKALEWARTLARPWQTSGWEWDPLLVQLMALEWGPAWGLL